MAPFIKRKPTHSLRDFQAAFAAGQAELVITKTAMLTAATELGHRVADIRSVIAALTFRDFDRSVESQHTRAVWHDIYHARLADGRVVFLKFVRDPDGRFQLTSYKVK